MDLGWTGKLGGKVAGTGTMEMYVEGEKREPTHGRGKKQMINEDDGEKAREPKSPVSIKLQEDWSTFP